jgi:predicted AAA+ superfamily ATPase
MESKSYIQRRVEAYAFDETLTGRHMVFLAGPRQVGKTMLAKEWLKKHRCDSLYYNWDDITTRQAYLADSRFFESTARALSIKDPWIVFDEIHKRTRWRDILKGAYDVFGEEFRFLITGSARLDFFRRSGDSLVGRHSLFHMMPLSMGEITRVYPETCFLKELNIHEMVKVFENAVLLPISMEIEKAYESLLQYGPFPEPFLKQNNRFCRKWHQDYISLIVREDLKDTSRVIELDKVENLLFLMPSRVTAPLSMANLARELEVAHTTVKNWLSQLNRLYILFSVSPWTRKVSRALKKEKKWYFQDWYYVPAEAAKLENLVATYLNRTCLALTDMGYGMYRLHYIRTIDKKKIDFLVTRDNTPVLAVEVKSGETSLSRTLKDRRNWLDPSPTLGLQVVDKRGVLKKHSDNTWIISVEKLLYLLF